MRRPWLIVAVVSTCFGHDGAAFAAGAPEPEPAEGEVSASTLVMLPPSRAALFDQELLARIRARLLAMANQGDGSGAAEDGDHGASAE